MFTNAWRILKNSYKSIARNIWISLSTLSIIVTALFVVGVLILFNESINVFTEELRDKVDVSIYFNAETDEQYILDIKEDLEKKEGIVKSVSYTSLEQAEQKFREDNANNAETVTALDNLLAENRQVLQPSLSVGVYDIKDFITLDTELENTLDTEGNIDTVNYRDIETIITRINNIADKINFGGIIFISLFGIFVFLVIYNTISLAIYSSSDEIHIMKLVGASNWFVRGPFIVAGAFYGIFAAVLVLAVLLGLTNWLGTDVSVIFSSINLFDYIVSNILFIAGTLLAIGVVLGALSSYIAVRRYLSI